MLDGNGIALLIEPVKKKKQPGFKYDVFLLGSTDIKHVFAVAADYRTLKIHSEESLVKEINGKLIQDHQRLHDALILYHEITRKSECIYNGIAWAETTAKGLLALQVHLGYAGDRCFRNLHYLANPFITTKTQEIKTMCFKSVAWRMGLFYMTPAVDQDMYVLLPHICEEARLSVENGPTISSGTLLFLARLQEHFKATKDIFGSMESARKHIEQLLTAAYVFYFDIRRDGNLSLHEFDNVPMINTHKKKFLQESPHAVQSFQRPQGDCVIT
ncbi:hypothetical protein HDE_12486 [Halotydeus destructor]|nr:hypothetical protein HDE_12486 [Halotydeus destructor]